MQQSQIQPTVQTNSNVVNQAILILDFDSQYSQLIARRIRELGVYCEVHPASIAEQKIAKLNPTGIILSGGPQSVTDKHSITAPEVVFKLDCPVLGICYGMQTMAQQLGGTIGTEHAEFGNANITYESNSPLFKSVVTDLHKLNVWMSHNDSVTKLPKGFTGIAQTNRCKYAAIADVSRKLYGIQFHAEVTNTQQGTQLLKNFVFNICGAQPNWNPSKNIEQNIVDIGQQVGDQQVILATSGGVDSSVVAALLHKALGKQVHCVFVDTGLLRLDEHNAITFLQKELGVQLQIIDASKQFLTALKGIDCPEQKRKVIGHEFIKVFQEYALTIPNAKWLGQGTIYPDVIESASGDKTIKSHHNVGGLPETMNLKLLEPIKHLFKDEVRKLGVALGLPKELVYRHPFPGPGLGVRILGKIKKKYIKPLQQADSIFIKELRKHKYYNKVAQAFAVFLPVKSVGVKGDIRHYGYVINLRAVTTSDFMTADWAQFSHSFLTHVSNRIVNEIPIVSRVVYDISSKPPATIEWE